jgi:hypothetical protein
MIHEAFIRESNRIERLCIRIDEALKSKDPQELINVSHLLKEQKKQFPNDFSAKLINDIQLDIYRALGLDTQKDDEE